jgi:hypothetical protein
MFLYNFSNAIYIISQSEISNYKIIFMITKNISKHHQLFQAYISPNYLTIDTSKLTYQ